jgi:hypothetical protein
VIHSVLAIQNVNVIITVIIANVWITVDVMITVNVKIMKELLAQIMAVAVL